MISSLEFLELGGGEGDVDGALGPLAVKRNGKNL